MRSPFLIAATLLYGAAAIVGDPPGHERLPALARDLVRPLVLPMVWRGLDSAMRNGSPEEYADKGRVLMALLPRWTDGHVHIAGRLAFEASIAQSDPDAALDRLLAGLDLLSRALEPDSSPQVVETILRNQAAFLYIRSSQDLGLAAAFHRRFGVFPDERVEDYMRAIPRFADSEHLRTELCFSIIDSLPTRILLGENLDRLLAEVSGALSLLKQLPDDDDSREWRASLAKLQRYLASPDDISLVELAAVPRLEKIVAALRERRH